MSDNVILEMRNITKEFPGVKALDNISFAVKQGEIHCLVGENGAGKSTLMKVLSGVYPHGTYSGDIYLNGELQRFNSIRDSEHAGIAIIYQELALIPELSVYENISSAMRSAKGRASTGTRRFAGPARCCRRSNWMSTRRPRSLN